MHKSGGRILKKGSKLNNRINSIIKILKTAFDLKKVILFGSFARGEERDSTIDLIIIAETKLRFFERIKKVLEIVHDDDLPIEPLVYTPNEFEMLKKSGEGFIEDAIEEGIIVYDTNNQK